MIIYKVSVNIDLDSITFQLSNMSLVKVKEKHQITLPSAIREEAGLNVGDWVEVKIEKGRVTLTPKSIIDRHIAEALKDIKAGRVYGPFNSAYKLIKSLHSEKKENRFRKGKMRVFYTDRFRRLINK